MLAFKCLLAPINNMWPWCHGSWVPGPILTVSCVCACAYVWAGVCGCVWLRLIRSSWASLPWAISGPVTLSPLSDPCGVCSVWSVCGRRLRSVPVPRFLSPAASWTPIAGPWLPIASLRYPPQPYGKLRFCLRKAPRLPTEAPPLPYGSSASALRKAPFSSRCVLLLVINSLFRNWILPSSLWQKDLTNLHGFSGDSWFARTDIRQQRSYGSPGGEYVEHRTSCAGVSGAGVRAHNPGTVTKITRCATHTA